MSYTLNLESELARQAEGYVKRRGTSLETLLRTHIIYVLQEESERERRVREFQELMRDAPHLEGEPYKFNRADAYEDEVEAKPVDDVELQMRKLSAIAEKYSGRVEQGYKFNRADAYPEEVYA